jgi:hypothetical protein
VSDLVIGDGLVEGIDIPCVLLRLCSIESGLW